MLISLTLGVMLLTAVIAFLHARSRSQLRVVHCPATREAAAVTLDPVEILTGHTRIGHCSLWPERAHCAQACLAEIRHTPDGCLFQAIVADWYRNKTCVYCCRRIGPIHWGEPRPALLSPTGRLVHWEEIPPTRIFATLGTHRAVCASCDIAESFRKEHPDDVIDRPPRPDAKGIVDERRLHS